MTENGFDLSLTAPILNFNSEGICIQYSQLSLLGGHASIKACKVSLDQTYTQEAALV